MSDKSRIYAVTDHRQPTQRARLVEATNPAQARGHVARSQYGVEVASQKQIAELVKAGVAVEVAGKEEPDSGNLPLSGGAGG